jgi:hypothetical protein
MPWHFAERRTPDDIVPDRKCRARAGSHLLPGDDVASVNVTGGQASRSDSGAGSRFELHHAVAHARRRGSCGCGYATRKSSSSGPIAHAGLALAARRSERGVAPLPGGGSRVRQEDVPRALAFSLVASRPPPHLAVYAPRSTDEELRAAPVISADGMRDALPVPIAGLVDAVPTRWRSY